MGTKLLSGMLDKLDAGIVPVLHLVAEDDLTIHIPQIFVSAPTRVQRIVAERFKQSLNHGSKAAKLELTMTSVCLRCTRSLFASMLELRSLHITDSNEHVQAVIGALVLSSPYIFRSMRRMEFGDQLDKALVVGLCRASASRSSLVGFASPASNVVKGHVHLQRICMQDGVIVEKYQCVVHGGTWDDER
ncbi:hypothetical protein R3P38DRAFT_2774464 [Favolaschia claudopus]|uniref:Uncharacterized protein n=1 Tax=Favolaschia claudopus TaxID=2862362 RepID=A0AAW0BZP8_9AGAR